MSEETPKPKRKYTKKTVKEGLPKGTPVNPNGTVPEGASVSAHALQHQGATLDLATSRHRRVYEEFERAIASGGSLENFDVKHGFALPLPDKYDICARSLNGATVQLQRVFPAPEGERLFVRINQFPTYPDLKSHLRKMWNGGDQTWEIAVRMGAQYPRAHGTERFEEDAVRRVEYEQEQRAKIPAVAAQPSQYGNTAGGGGGLQEILVRALLDRMSPQAAAPVASGGGTDAALLAALGGGKDSSSTVNLLLKHLFAERVRSQAPQPPAQDPLTMMLMKHLLEKDKNAAGGLAQGYSVDLASGMMLFHGVPVAKFATTTAPAAGETFEEHCKRLERQDSDRDRLAKVLNLKKEEEPKAKPNFEEVGGFYIPLDKHGGIDEDASFSRWFMGNFGTALKQGKDLLEEGKKWIDKEREKEAIMGNVDPRRSAQLDLYERELVAKAKKNAEDERELRNTAERIRLATEARAIVEAEEEEDVLLAAEDSDDHSVNGVESIA